jgi:hypothetical protein
LGWFESGDRRKVAVVGWGQSHMDRRWDGVTMDRSCGGLSKEACLKAIADEGLSLDDIDGLITSAETRAEQTWAPRPYFAPPYDTEDGLTKASAEWIQRELGFKNVKYLESDAPIIGPKHRAALLRETATALFQSCVTPESTRPQTSLQVLVAEWRAGLRDGAGGRDRHARVNVVLRQRVVVLVHVRADAVHERSVQRVEAFGAAEHARGRIAGGGSSTRGSHTKKASGREDVQEVSAGQAATQAVKRTLIVRAARRDSLG